VRVRVIAGLVVALLLCGGVAIFLALWDGGPRSSRTGVLTVGLSDLRTGSAKAVAVSLPDKKHTKARIFVARGRSRDVTAFLGVSTHLGCRLLLPGDPGYGQGFTRTSRRYLFEDPCGGSVYALNGDCTGGPCPRGLDRYAVEVRDDTAEVDLNHLVAGPPRGA
jgi:Rieske Fe-S protein